VARRPGGGAIALSGLVGTDGPLRWYVNRSTGLVLLVLLVASALLGEYVDIRW
jgi:hypothetical protein